MGSRLGVQAANLVALSGVRGIGWHPLGARAPLCYETTRSARNAIAKEAPFARRAERIPDRLQPALASGIFYLCCLHACRLDHLAPSNAHWVVARFIRSLFNARCCHPHVLLPHALHLDAPPGSCGDLRGARACRSSISHAPAMGSDRQCALQARDAADAVPGYPALQQ